MGDRLKGTPYRLANSTLRVGIPAAATYFYPDLSIFTGPRFDPPEPRVNLINPQVLVEITSPATTSFDWSQKLHYYTGIEPLREYVLVAQDCMQVTAFHRGADGNWIVAPWADGMNASITFPSLGVTVPLAEVYAGVEFSSTGKSPV